MTLDRRLFLQGLCAGFAVAAMPASIALAERTAAATEIMRAPGWLFTIMGGSGGVGDSLLMHPPGVPFSVDDYLCLVWPEPLNVNALMAEGDAVRLIPWRPYVQDFEHLIPTELWARYQRARTWAKRR